MFVTKRSLSRRAVLRGLGAGFPLPILLAQHIAQGFVSLLCDWLNTATPVPARVAQRGERLQAGQLYLAPLGDGTPDPPSPPGPTA